MVGIGPALVHQNEETTQKELRSFFGLRCALAGSLGTILWLAAPTILMICRSQNGKAVCGNHNNNSFYLVFTRDDFETDTIIPVPDLGATSYTPTDTGGGSVQSGDDPGVVYKWLVTARRSDGDIVVPEGWCWYSVQRTSVPCAYSAKITWSPLGADVDFHLANPGGSDIAYLHKVGIHLTHVTATSRA